jgi:hypothetical protein
VIITSGELQQVDENNSVDRSVTFSAPTGSFGTATITYQQTNLPSVGPEVQLGQINVVGSCPPPGGGGGGGSITGSANPPQLDVFPDDALPSGVTITTTWSIPAGFGNTTITFRSPHPLVSAGPGSVISDGQTSDVTSRFGISQTPPVTSPIATQLVFTARSANGRMANLTVPLRIENTRPQARIGTGGDVRNGVITFGTAGVDDIVTRSLTLTNQGPALSRFRGPIWDFKNPPYSIVSAHAFSQSRRADDAWCLPVIDLSEGDGCEYTLQMKFSPNDRAGQTTDVVAFGGWTDPARVPGNGVSITLVGELFQAELIVPLKWLTW